MKNSKGNLLFMLFLLGISLPALSQVTLPEITITAVRYKYLSAVGDKDLAQPVKLLERQTAEYNVKKSEFYEDEYGDYFVSFFIPEGKILAAYDANGKLLRTAEKYKNIALPKAVAAAVSERFPGWKISQDVYLVSYNESSGARKTYKLLLENGDKRLKVKTDETGKFL